MLFDGCIQAKPFVVTICGGAGAGKSQLARATAAELGEALASRVPTDYFLIPRRQGESREHFLARPLMYDWPLLSAALDAPMGTHQTTPDFDFEEFRRLRESGGRPYVVRPVMLCDAMAPYPGADLVVRLDAPVDVRMARVAERDTGWRTRVRDRSDQLEETWRAVMPVAADVELDGRLSLSGNAARLAMTIQTATENGRDRR